MVLVEFHIVGSAQLIIFGITLKTCKMLMCLFSFSSLMDITIKVGHLQWLYKILFLTKPIQSRKNIFVDINYYNILGSSVYVFWKVQIKTYGSRW